MRSVIKFFLDNTTAVLILVFAIVLLGASAYRTLPREAAPDLQIPVVLATIPYPGVSPADVETLITNEVEKELKDLKDVKEMRSTSAEGAAIVTLEFNPSVDIDDAVRKVREKVDMARPQLPEDAEDPVVEEVSFEDFPILTVSLSADYSLVRLKQVAEDLQDKLETIPGVLEVKLTGGIEREIQVLVDPDRLSFHSVSIDEVLRAVQGENVNMPGGQVNAGSSSFLVRVPGEYETAAEIESVVIKTRALLGGDHTSLRVKDVAEVRDTFQERTTKSRLNRKDTVSLQVTKRAGENLIEISEEVKRMVREAEPTLPPGTNVTFLGDQSVFIRSMVNDLQNNILTGLLLVLAVLPFFLTVRSSQIVASAIPLAMLISLFVLQAFGITLNMIVLFSLILSLGMLVDNSIVVVENAYRLLSEGKGRVQAALEGALQVAWPVIASTATTVAAFVPLLFWPGIMGEFMGYLPRTLIITLLSSLFVALCINPVMCALILRVNEKHVTDDDSEPTGWLYRKYRSSLVWALKHRALTLAGVLGAFVGTIALYGSMGLGVEFFPRGTPDTVFIEARAADGTRLEATDAILQRVEAVLDGNPHIENYTTSVGFSSGGGGTAPHLGTVQVDFIDEELRTESTLDTVEDLRPKIEAIAGATFEIRKQENGPPSGAPIGIEVVGDDWDTLGKITTEVRQRIRDIEGLVDLKDDFNLGRPEVQVRVDREKAKLVGTSTMQVAQAVRTAINGTKATALRDGLDEYDVIVRLQEQRRDTLESLAGLLITGREGHQVPLRELATVVTTSGAGSIKHKDRDRVISITADADGRLPDEVRKDVVKALDDLELPAGFSWRLAGENEEQEKAQAFLGRAGLLAILAILMIIVLQFNSLLTPLVIMTSVILSVIGVLWGLIIFRMPFGVIMTGLGVISLAGVAVNNAIVLIDFIRSQHERTADVTEAIVRAGVIRLRPVLLTAITTVLGLLPMVFGVSVDFVNAEISVGGRSGEIWKSMAIAVSFGLVATTFLTLIVVPVLSHLVERFRIRTAGLRGRWFPDDERPAAQGGRKTSAAAPATAEDASSSSEARDVSAG